MVVSAGVPRTPWRQSTLVAEAQPAVLHAPAADLADDVRSTVAKFRPDTVMLARTENGLLGLSPWLITGADHGDVGSASEVVYRAHVLVRG